MANNVSCQFWPVYHGSYKSCQIWMLLVQSHRWVENSLTSSTSGITLTFVRTVIQFSSVSLRSILVSLQTVFDLKISIFTASTVAAWLVGRRSVSSDTCISIVTAIPLLAFVDRCLNQLIKVVTGFSSWPVLSKQLKLKIHVQIRTKIVVSRFYTKRKTGSVLKNHNSVLRKLITLENFINFHQGKKNNCKISNTIFTVLLQFKFLSMHLSRWNLAVRCRVPSTQISVLVLQLHASNFVLRRLETNESVRLV